MARAFGKTNNRLSVNAVSLLVTFCVLFVAVTVSDGSFANSIDKISRNLDVALEDLKDDMPNYTDYRESDRAFARLSFNPKGMAGLYNLTVKIMDWILDKDVVTRDLLDMHDPKHPQLNPKLDMNDLLMFYWPVLVLVLVLASMAVLLPLCGFCVCCCRCCCGNCGGRARPCDKRRDLCRKVMLGTVLIVLGTALLFCVVCAFASNEQLSGGIDDLPDNLVISRNTASYYLDSTDKQLDLLLIDNFNEFSKQFLETLGKSGDYMMQDLNEVSNALALINLKTFVDSLPRIKNSTEKLKASTNSLRVYASQLNDAMRKVKRDLLNTLHNCQDQEVCKNLLKKINNLKTNIDFDKLPDITPLINNLEELPNDDLHKAVTEGKNQLDKIETNIRTHLENALKNVRGSIAETNKTIQENLHNVKDTLGQVQNQMLNKTEHYLTDLRTYIQQYNRYLYYVGFGISMLLLLIATGITFGLVCGICGKRPDGYNDNCCNKGVGSQFLMCSVAIMFLFGFFIAIVAFVFLLLGLTTNRVVCYPLRNPDHSTLLAYVDKYMQGNTNKLEIDVKITQALEYCYHNQSIYNVLNLKNKFNLDELHKKADISEYLKDMQESVSDIIPEKFKILSGPNMKVLKELGERELSINFEQFENELNANFTNLNLKDISKQLRDIRDQVPNEEIKKEVKLSILHIDTYDEKLLTPMNDISQEMIQTAHELDDHLRMGAKDFQTAIKNLTTSIEEAEVELNRHGPELIKRVINDFGNVVQNQVNSYLYRVGNVTKNELGQCGLLSLAINQTLTATCDKVIMPMNGFWVTLVLSLILFIPTLIVSVKLANLYQRYKPNGHYVETRGGNKRGKKKPKKGKKYEDRPQNMGGEVVTREYAAGSHPPDSRYGDMAPKHWEDFPNGGPPQYQRAPTEYERPPPYYYPATGDQ